MSAALLAGLLSLIPAGALWLAWPRRRWAVWGGGSAALAVWAAGLAGVAPEQRGVWLLAGVWSLALCAYASYVVTRNAAEYDGLEEMLAGRESEKTRLVAEVAQSRARSKDIETEQREVLALYGMVKGLSEALSWEDIRPKLEVAVQQYLRVEEFALYVTEGLAQDRLKILARRRMVSGAGSSWDTLQRALQERGLPITVPHVLPAPEAAIALPIFDGPKLMGYVYARIPPATDAQVLLRKGQTFVDEIAFAFRRVRLYQDMERLSLVDGLTGVHRRGVLDERLKEEVIRAQTFKTGFCLIILDVDRFKSLNDRYGHPFGDQVLRRVGEILKTSVYDTDFVARYGGEEFAILLPRADPAGVLRKAEQIRKAIEGEPFELAMDRVPVTVSIGIAHFPRDAADGEGIVRAADQALYRAKESGRNRSVDAAELRGPA